MKHIVLPLILLINRLLFAQDTHNITQKEVNEQIENGNYTEPDYLKNRTVL